MSQLKTFIINDVAFQSDPIPILREMRESGAVVEVKLPIFGAMPALTRYDDIDRYLRDHQRFARDGAKVGKRSVAAMPWWMPRIIRLVAKNMLSVDEPDHRRLRGLVEQAFVKRNIDSMNQSITTIADSLIDRIRDLERRDGQVDVLKHFCRQFPLAVICELLGLPDYDRAKFTRWFAALGNFGSPIALVKILPGFFKSRRYLRQSIEQYRQEPGFGLISDLVQAEQDGAKLSDDELIAMVYLLLLAGHETTTHLIADGMLTLLDHPQQKEQLMDDWSLTDSAIDEMLRYVSPVQMCKPRYVVEDTEFGGVKLKRGSLLIGMLASANLDPEQFPDPEKFDITRSPNRHLTFGRGIHICLGMKLAKAEAGIAFQRLLSRFPDLKLAIPRDQIKWNSRIGIRTLQTLPVVLGAEATG